MDRRKILLDGIAKTQPGIEIGAYFSPLVPKKEGYNSLTVDVWNQDELQRLAKLDPNIPDDLINKIETVDLVGSVTTLGEMIDNRGLVSKLDYIISSHNFEHVPDQMRFLAACERGLKPGGVVITAIPDRRTCFDYFRPHSLTGDFISAYFEKRNRPTHYQVFIEESLRSQYHVNGKQHGSFSINFDPSFVVPVENLADAYRDLCVAMHNPEGVYRDTHCWAFTPASFELIINDLWFLGLSRMKVHSILGPNRNEFYTRLTVRPVRLNSDLPQFYARRAELLHRIGNEAYANSLSAYQEYFRLGKFCGKWKNTQWQIERLRKLLTTIENSTGWKIKASLRRIIRALRPEA